MSKLAIVTVHKDFDEDLLKTVKSVRSQKIKPDLHLIVAKKINKFLKKKIKNKYTKIIAGKDKSLWNAMNIGLKKTSKYHVIFINSGDELIDFETVTLIKSAIKKYKDKCLIFKNLNIYDEMVFDIKEFFFNKDNYSPHPSFVRPPSNKIFFNEKVFISADALWIKQNINLFGKIKIYKNLSMHYLGGQSSKPTFFSTKHQFTLSFFDGFKELMKLILLKIFSQKFYYILIYFYKCKIRYKNFKQIE
jgi:hypothetical protein